MSTKRAGRRSEGGRPPGDGAGAFKLPGPHPGEFKDKPYEVAQVYWDLPLEERSLENVAKRLGIALPEDAADNRRKNYLNQIGRLIRDAELAGFVRHLVSSEPIRSSYLPLIPDMEDGIRRRYGLRDVVVVDISHLDEPADDPVSNPVGWDKYDDSIHQHLGKWGGRILASLINYPHERIATGSGRGPYFAAASCIIPRSCSYFAKQVVSLTGRMSAHVWSEDQPSHQLAIPRSLDADLVANALASGLGTELPPRLVGCSITAQHPPPETKDVSMALIGIGSLSAGHRLVRYQNCEDLRDVLPELKDLNGQIQRIETAKAGYSPFEHWVGDVCNTLFVVDDLAGKSLDPKKRRDLEKVIGTLNERFVNTSPKVLAEICDRGAVIAVAGGRHKVAALTHVLKHPNDKPWITHLVTDSRVGRELLR